MLMKIKGVNLFWLPAPFNVESHLQPVSRPPQSNPNGGNVHTARSFGSLRTLAKGLSLTVHRAAAPIGVTVRLAVRCSPL
jgi:hypothetical protein